jgi:Family of unknown function (DUF6527)
MKLNSIELEFVELIPPELSEGTLYVSMIYTTTVHLCACGCGNKVVLPLSPVDWQMYFDGEAVSLTPSAGNWEFPCHSHYWIKGNKIRWAAPWTKEQIAAGRSRDAKELETHFADRLVANDVDDQPAAQDVPRRGRLLLRIHRWFNR